MILQYMSSAAPQYMTDEYLAHHGIKGMHWGVRRFQNYDGSYTKKGLERYRKADDAYAESAKKTQQLKDQVKKGIATKEQLRVAKAEQKAKKRTLNESYDHLKSDYKADQGKQLYKEGKRIIGNQSIWKLTQIGVAVGSYAVGQVIESKTGDTKLANLSAAAIAIGGTAVNAALGIKLESDNNKLRAYYSHSQWKG